MSVPRAPGKHAGKAVIEPATVIEERRAIGRHPSGPVPAGAIICYDSALWQWVGTLPGRVACDGWLEGAQLLPHAGWHQGYHSEEKREGLRRVFEVALETIATTHGWRGGDR